MRKTSGKIKRKTHRDAFFHHRRTKVTRKEEKGRNLKERTSCICSDRLRDISCGRNGMVNPPLSSYLSCLLYSSLSVEKNKTSGEKKKERKI